MKKRFDASKTAELAKEQEFRELSRKLATETHFTQTECEAILKLHSKITADTPLDRSRFRSVLFSAFEISNTFILDRLFHVCDQGDTGIITGDEFVSCLSTMMRGTLDELIVFCYDVYDVNGDRSLAREELFMALEGSLRPGRGILDNDEVEEGIKDVVEMAMKKLDVNRDGQITFEDFKSAVRADPTLLQVCGMCLPPSSYSRAVQYLFTTDHTNVTPCYKENWAARERIRRQPQGRKTSQNSKAGTGTYFPLPNFTLSKSDSLLSRISSTAASQTNLLTTETLPDIKTLKSKSKSKVTLSSSKHSQHSKLRLP